MPRPSAAPREGTLRPDRRLRAWVITVLVALSLLAGRLVQLQGADASALADAALKQRVSTQTLWADRGDIVDANGVQLATSVERRDIAADPVIMDKFNLVNGKPYDSTKGTGPAGAAAVLAPLLGLDVDTLTAKLTGTSRYALIAKGVTPQVWQRVSDAGIAGVTATRTTQRIYPTGEAASTLVGVLGTSETTKGVTQDNPLSGLELADDSALQGANGWMRYERSLGGQQIPLADTETKEPVDGDSLHLTIDSDLQWKAQTAIAAKVAETGAQSGTVVIMDRQQHLLALASAPTVDPADTTSYTNDNLKNTAFTDVFEPGSTAKMITMAAALQEGAVTAGTDFTVPGELPRWDKTFHDSHPHGVLKLTLAGIVAQSSNIGTILAGERIDADEAARAETLYRYQRAFGLGQKTAIDFPGETKGLVYAPKDYSGKTQDYTVMFGQGLSVNAVQAASVFATIANDGVRVEPSVVAGVSDPDGNYRAAAAGASTRVVSPATASTLRDMMQSVVSSEGTAAAAEIPGYLVAGKTGTANRYDTTLGKYSGYTASFIGMAPADDPQLVVAVILQDPKTNYYGGSAAGPVFQDVMSYALTQRGIAPSTQAPANLPLTWGTTPDEAAATEAEIATGAESDATR